MPAVGYGIRYDFGIFKQTFRQRRAGRAARRLGVLGQSVGVPGARTTARWSASTAPSSRSTAPARRRRWEPGETVLGEPSHMLVPGYGTETVNIVRLWRARAARESFDLARFGAGQYAEAVQDVVRSENISKVLYPDDSTELGPRAAPQAAVLPGLLLAAGHHPPLPASATATGTRSPTRPSIQLNDTHPVLAIPELMRLLVDEYGLAWDRAWTITRAHVRLHLPHAAAGGAGDVAGRAAGTPPPPAPGDHLRDQPRLPAGGGAAIPGRRRPGPPDVADPGGAASAGSGWRIWPWSARTPSTASPSCTPSCSPRPRCADFAAAVAGEVPQRHQRRHPAAFPADGQPAAVRADQRRRSAATSWLTDLDRLQRPRAVRRRSRRSASSGGRSSGTTRSDLAAYATRTALTDVIDQAVPRVQAPAAQAAARDHAVPPDQGRARRRRRGPSSSAARRRRATGRPRTIIRLINAVADVVNADPVVSPYLKVVVPAQLQRDAAPS